MSDRKLPHLTLRVHLKPTRSLSSRVQTAFWHRVLDVDFRNAIGKPKTDHVNSGSIQESHVLYTLETIDIAIYSRGDTTIEDDEFIPSHSVKIERIVESILRTITQAANKRVYMQVDAYIHVILSSKSMERFLINNVRFSPTAAFKRLFAPAAIVTFVLRISKNLSIAFVGPNHLDFLYFDKISTGTDRKAFLSRFTRTALKYLKSLERRA